METKLIAKKHFAKKTIKSVKYIVIIDKKDNQNSGRRCLKSRAKTKQTVLLLRKTYKLSIVRNKQLKQLDKRQMSDPISTSLSNY